MTSKLHNNLTIPQFSLYGEHAVNQDPAFVHIEAISARSSKNDWIIKPHRHTHLFQILHMFNGEVEIELDDSSASLTGSWAITIPSGVVHGFKFNPRTQGMVLSVATHLLSLGADNRTEGILEEMTTQSQIIDFRNNVPLHRQLKQYMRLINRELINPFVDQQFILYSLLNIILTTLRRQIRHGQIVDTDHVHGIQITNKFRSLLEKRYKEHWKIKDYAGQLNISVSTLNRLCHQAFNDSAKSIIKERLIIEAKRKLIYTVETLENIAYELGFKDPAYFSRFFKQCEGLSPKAFRQSLRPN